MSCGSCWDTCPVFFEQNPDDTFNQGIENFGLDGKITMYQSRHDLGASARDAADPCPVQIINIER